MNERQSKLKSILDRWTACTITIEQAQEELQPLFKPEWTWANCNPPYSGAFDLLDGTGRNTPSGILTVSDSIGVQVDEQRIETTHIDEIERVFVDAERLSNQLSKQPAVVGGVHSYQPQSVASKVGSFEVQSDPFDTTWKASFDGETLREHRKLTLVMEAGCLPVVTIEFVPVRQNK